MLIYADQDSDLGFAVTQVKFNTPLSFYIKQRKIFNF